MKGSYQVQSTWRSPLYINANRQSVPGITVATTDIKSSNWRNISQHPDSGKFLLSSLDGEFLMMKKKGSQFKENFSFKTPLGSTALDWKGNICASGTKEGDLVLYTWENKNMITLSTLKHSDTPASRLGFINSLPSCFNCVSLHPSEPQLIGLKKDMMLLWDIDAGVLKDIVEQPNLSYQKKHVPIKAEWSKVYESYVLIASANSVKLNDLRVMSSMKEGIWKTIQPHTGVIRDIKWNQFIPFWFATAATDGVKIWDIRKAESPVLTLSDFSNGVKKVDWSPTHCEILSTTGYTNEIKIWNLRTEPTFLTANIRRTDEPVISSFFSLSKGHRSDLLSINSSTIYTIKFEDSFLKPQIPHKGADSNIDVDTITEIQEGIYLRHFESAFRKALVLATRYKEQKKYDLANEVINLCYQQGLKEPQPELSSKNFDDETFFSDLQYYSTCVPPGYPDPVWPEVDRELLINIGYLKHNISLETCLANNDLEKLIQSLSNMKKYLLNMGPNIYSSELLIQIFKVLNLHDSNLTIDTARDFAKIYRKLKMLGHFLPVIQYLLSPTIFDEDENVQESTKVNKILIESGEINRQLDILVITNQLLEEDADEDRIITALSGTVLSSLSVSIHRLYFSALLEQNEYDRYFADGSELLDKVEGYPFYEEFYNEYMDAFPALMKHTRSVYGENNTEELMKLIHTYLLLLTESVKLPDQMASLLRNTFKRVTNEFSEILSSLPESEAKDLCGTLHIKIIYLHTESPDYTETIEMISQYYDTSLTYGLSNASSPSSFKRTFTDDKKVFSNMAKKKKKTKKKDGSETSSSSYHYENSTEEVFTLTDASSTEDIDKKKKKKKKSIVPLDIMKPGKYKKEKSGNDSSRSKSGRTESERGSDKADSGREIIIDKKSNTSTRKKTAKRKIGSIFETFSQTFEDHGNTDKKKRTSKKGNLRKSIGRSATDALSHEKGRKSVEKPGEYNLDNSPDEVSSESYEHKKKKRLSISFKPKDKIKRKASVNIEHEKKDTGRADESDEHSLRYTQSFDESVEKSDVKSTRRHTKKRKTEENHDTNEMIETKSRRHLKRRTHDLDTESVDQSETKSSRRHPKRRKTDKIDEDRTDADAKSSHRHKRKTDVEAESIDQSEKKSSRRNTKKRRTDEIDDGKSSVRRKRKTNLDEATLEEGSEESIEQSETKSSRHKKRKAREKTDHDAESIEQSETKSSRHKKKEKDSHPETESIEQSETKSSRHKKRKAREKTDHDAESIEQSETKSSRHKKKEKKNSRPETESEDHLETKSSHHKEKEKTENISE
eukprot:TRINITY_DN4944_c0_g1_i1.p1 TRINITY_DN4944_c0_g1~~TRINITY_DN4944_c0_g1_i1.p1  ORF type:complete len:1296 (+),score=323.10 TRINITY_DN4944_c0_g1_i1:11-3898(+)